MKINVIAAIGASIAIILSAFEVRGQYRPLIIQPPTQVFPWGSTNALAQFAATNTQNMVVAIYQGANYGGQADFGGFFGTAFGNVSNINAAFQELLMFTANLTLTNPVIDKTQPVYVGGYAWNDDYPLPNDAWFPFIVPWNPHPSFSFVEQNGVWDVPDLSGISMVLPSQMVFYVPGLEWARIEVYSNTNLVSPFLVVDSRYPTSFSVANSIDTTNQSIIIATPYLASGNSGLYRLNVSILTSNGGFHVVDGNGMQVAETSLVPAVITSGNVASVTVTGGNPGRVFEVEKSLDLQTWSVITGMCTVGTNTDWSCTTVEPLKTRGFYRTVALPIVPQ